MSQISCKLWWIGPPLDSKSKVGQFKHLYQAKSKNVCGSILTSLKAKEVDMHWHWTFGQLICKCQTEAKLPDVCGFQRFDQTELHFQLIFFLLGFLFWWSVVSSSTIRKCTYGLDWIAYTAGWCALRKMAPCIRTTYPVIPPTSICATRICSDFLGEKWLASGLRVQLYIAQTVMILLLEAWFMFHWNLRWLLM